MKKRYSGNKSKKFWKKINLLRNKSISDWNVAYSLGCRLQETEGVILKQIEDILKKK